MMPRVKNLTTGLEHDVPEGHYSLSSSEYQLVEEAKTPRESKPATDSKAKAKAKK